MRAIASFADLVGEEQRVAGVRSAAGRCSVSTRRPSETFARIGFSFGSCASSVMLNSVSFTGRARRSPQTKIVSGAVGGRISIVPSASSWRVGDHEPAPRVDSISSADSCG